MHTHIDTDIKFDESTEINKDTKKELLEELNTGKIDKALLHDLRKSISVNPVHPAEEHSESESSEEDLSVESPVGQLEHFSHRSDTAFDKLFRPVAEDHGIHLRNNAVPKLNTTTQVVSFMHAQRPNTPAENIEITKTEIKTTEITTTEITTMFSNIDAFCDNIIGGDSPHIHEHFETIVEREPVCDAQEIAVEESQPIMEEPQPIVEEVQPIMKEVQKADEPQEVVEPATEVTLASPEVEEEGNSLPDEEEKSLPEEEEKSLPEEEAKTPQEDDSKTKKKKPRKKKA